MAYQGNQEYGQAPQGYNTGGNYEVVVIPGSFFSSSFSPEKIKQTCAEMEARGLKLVGTSSIDFCGCCLCMCKKPSLTLIFGPM